MDQSASENDERQLISRCLSGQETAFQSLYAAHGGRVKAYFLRSGFAGADADDLTQETFLRAFNSLGGFDGRRGSFGGWLAAVARNVARKHWLRRSGGTNIDPALAEEMFASAGNPATDAAGREEIDAVRECVEDLPASLGRMVRLRYVDGLTTRGLAGATGLAESTVRLRLTEAMAMLSRCLKAKGFFQ